MTPHGTTIHGHRGAGSHDLAVDTAYDPRQLVHRSLGCSAFIKCCRTVLTEQCRYITK